MALDISRWQDWLRQAGDVVETGRNIYDDVTAGRPAESPQEREVSERDQRQGDAGFFGMSQQNIIIAALAAVVLVLVLKR